MERFMDLDSETDGKLYKSHEMAELYCNDCSGCSSCCKKMGKSIVLDPYDIYMLKKNLNMSFEALLEDKVELSVCDNLILPNIRLSGDDESCGFLNDAGRCTIHEFRPGFCRLFPLGRLYNCTDFDYILQTNECAVRERGKVRIDEWLGISSLKKYEKFVSVWHYFIRDVGTVIEKSDESVKKNAGVVILKWFYQQMPTDSDFFTEFYKRYQYIKSVFSMEN